MPCMISCPPSGRNRIWRVGLLSNPASGTSEQDADSPISSTTPRQFYGLFAHAGTEVRWPQSRLGSGVYLMCRYGQIIFPVLIFQSHIAQQPRWILNASLSRHRQVWCLLHPQHHSLQSFRLQGRPVHHRCCSSSQDYNAEPLLLWNG